MANLGRTIRDIPQTIQAILDALAGKLTFEENLFCDVVTIADSGTANSVNTVAHSLQYIPTGYIANVNKAGVVYDYNRSSWTSSQIQIKCASANAAITLVIF